MKTRLLSAIIALPIFIIPMVLGGLPFYGLIFAATIISLYEFNKAFKIQKKVVFAMQIIFTMILYSGLYFGIDHAMMVPVIGFFISLEIYYNIIHAHVSLDSRLKTEQVMQSVFSFIYLPVMISHVILVRNTLAAGHVMIWFIFIVAFGSDTFAYFVGKSMGKHKLAKVLSPNKTVEGSVGGLLGAMVLSFAFSLYLDKQVMSLSQYMYIWIVVTGIIGAVLGQFGDITASAMKRLVNVKDYGNVMPGHGGILDRIDSIIFVAPFVYYSFNLMMKIL